MKTLDQIRKRIEEQMKTDDGDFFVTLCEGYHPLAPYLPEMYKEECKNDVRQLTRVNILEDMQEYMGFALKKARGQRGLSAIRSQFKYREWLWVLDDTGMSDAVMQDCGDYGLQILERIQEKYKLKEPCDDNGM